GVADDVALLERAEHGALDALDLEGAATAGDAVAAEGFLEEGLARGGVAVAPRGEGGGDVLELARVGRGVLGCAQAVVAGSARGVVGVAEVGDEQARAAEMG